VKNHISQIEKVNKALIKLFTGRLINYCLLLCD